MKRILIGLLLLSQLSQGQVKLSGNGDKFGWLLNGKPFFYDYLGQLWTSDGTPPGTRIFTNKVKISGYGNFTMIGTDFLFSGETPGSGTELWRTDGTDAGTALVKEIRPGVNGSGVTSFLHSSNKQIFFADDGTHGLELWITDGTTVGTTLLKDIHTGPEGSIQPGDYISSIEVSGQHFFMANNGTQGWALWKTDGTTAGTVLVKDLDPSPDESSANNVNAFTKFGNNIYFVAETVAHGMELWRSDGTTAGTYMVKDIVPDNSGGVEDDGMIVYNNKLLFSVFMDNGPQELWTSDGSSAGTVKVKSFTEEGTSLELVFGIVFPNGLLFAQHFDNGAKLWRTDGTPAGTVQITAPGNVYDIWIRNSYTQAQNFNLPPFAGRVFFTTSDQDQMVGQLWLTDGTESGTRVVASIGGIDSDLYDGNLFYFFGNHQTTADSVSLYQTDGTTTGTNKLHSFKQAPYPFNYSYPFMHFVYGGHLYFSIDDLQDQLYRRDLYRTGTPQALQVYTFTGNGSWDNPANWQNNQVPPANLASGEIIINPAAGGECVMSASKTFPRAVKLTVLSGKLLRVTN